VTISKIDLLGKKFNRCMRGYCPEEVDLVMHDAAEALGEAADENRRLLERLADLERSQSGRAPEPALSQAPADIRGTLAAGRKIVVEVHENARREASRILDDARAEGGRIVADANLAKARIFEEIADLRAQREAFEQELRKTLEDHFRLLESSGTRAAGGSGGDFIFADGSEGRE
jgi:cell division initiation protein